METEEFTTGFSPEMISTKHQSPVAIHVCGLTLLLVLALLSQWFVSGFSDVPPSTKTNTSYENYSS